MKKTYYFANADRSDSIYGSEMPVCIDRAEVERLAREWGMTTEELLEQMHEATPEEVEEYGVYNS